MASRYLVCVSEKLVKIFSDDEHFFLSCFMALNCILNTHNKGICNVYKKHNKDADPSFPLRYGGALTAVNAHVHYTFKILGQNNTYVYVKICVIAK